MSDSNIIKALECCVKAKTCSDCKDLGCPAHTVYGCSYYTRSEDDCEEAYCIELMKDALSLINRQKAEIEALKLINSTYVATTEEIREIAIKEFAERLKKHSRKMQSSDFSGDFWDAAVLVEEIDNIVKEMVGERRGE